jgi:hypothetical protein
LVNEVSSNGASKWQLWIKSIRQWGYLGVEEEEEKMRRELKKMMIHGRTNIC